MFIFQIKGRLDLILLGLLVVLVQHQVLTKSTSDDTLLESHDGEEVAWNGWPDTSGVSEIQALVDYTTGLVFYKDASVPACFVEKHQHHSIHRDESPNLPKVLSVTSKLHKITDSDEWANSLFKQQFCGPLPVYKIETLEEVKLKRLPRKRRQTREGSLSGSQAQAGSWPSSSQTQVQGSVAGQGFFSGQAQAAHGGYSQSQVQLGGQGITGNLQSSAGNAQSQLSLGEHGGAGQASSFGQGPSNSQVQVNVGQRERGSHASANVFQQHVYDQSGSGLGTRGAEGHERLSPYPGTSYGSGQQREVGHGGPQDYQQGSGIGEGRQPTYTGHSIGSPGATRNGYTYPASGNGQDYRTPQFSLTPQSHTSYSNGRSTAQQPQTISSHSSTGNGHSAAPGLPSLQIQPQTPVFDPTVPLPGSQGIHGQSPGFPTLTQPQVQPPRQTGAGYTQPGVPLTRPHIQPPRQTGTGYTQPGTSHIQQPIQTSNGYTQPGVPATQTLHSGTSGGTGTNGQTSYPQQGLHTPSGTSQIRTQDHGGSQRPYDTYSPSTTRDGSGRQSQSQGMYINSNIQPPNGHGISQQATQNGDHRRRHGNGAYPRGSTHSYTNGASAGTGYGTYATAPGGQAQAQSLHVGSFGTTGHDYSGGHSRTPYYSTSPQGTQVPAGVTDGSVATNGAVVKNGYTNGHVQGGTPHVNGQSLQTGQGGTLVGGDGYRSQGETQGHKQNGANGVHRGTTNGNGHHVTHHRVTTNGNGHQVTDHRVTTVGNGHQVTDHRVTTVGNGHQVTDHRVTTNGNGHHVTDQRQPSRSNGVNDQEHYLRRNGNGHHGSSQGQYGKPANGQRNGHSISVNGYSGNGHRGVTNGYQQHQQPQYNHRQPGTNGYGTSSPSKPQPQCTVITFTCTIVIESNGRAKLCKPKSTSSAGNGNGAAGNTDQMVCCC